MTKKIDAIANRYIVILQSLASMAQRGEPISDLAWVISKSCVETMLEAGADENEIMDCFGGKIMTCLELTASDKPKYRTVLETAYDYLVFCLEIKGISNR